jgi:flagellar hook assembly protein FlgD
VKIKLRVQKEYKNLAASNANFGKPMYSWNMNDIATRTNDSKKLTEVLDLINVVPNPYYAYSEYETGRLDTKVKITNLPEKCTVSIYTVNGKLVRQYKKDNTDTYQDWDLNNFKGIAVAGGVYLIHVEVPGAGERVIKFFGGMRQVDLQSL